jgi:hypothetical protein
MTDPSIAYSAERRRADMRREVKRAFDGGWLPTLRPGYMAGTFGVTKDEVKAEIKRFNELAGDGK